MKTCSQAQEKINGFPSNVQHLESANLHKFPLTHRWQGVVNTAGLCEIICKHLRTFEGKLSFYFPSAFIEWLDCVRDP